MLAARGAFEFGEPVTVEAKGKAGGLECRRLVRALSLMRPRGVGGLRPAFVGREAELAQLQEAYAAVAAGKGPQLVTILGDAGVGKTRLVRELWEWFAAQDSPPLRRTGRCLSYGQGITYWPLAEVLKVTISLGTSGTIYTFAETPVVDPRGEISAFCDSTDHWLALACTMNMANKTPHQGRRPYSIRPPNTPTLTGLAWPTAASTGRT